MAKEIKKKTTLLQAMERVVELSNDSKLSRDLFRKAKTEIKQLSDSFGITDLQAVLFCVCMEKGPRCIDYNDLASHLDISKIKILSYASDIDALVRRRLLKYRDVKDEEDFDIPTAVIRCLKHNEVYQLPNRKGLNCSELFELIGTWFEDLGNDAISTREMKEELNTLFKENPQVDFVKKLESLNLNSENTLLLVFFCHLLINEEDDDIRFGQMERIFDNVANYNKTKAELRSGEHTLIKRKLIEHLCEDGIADTTKYHLTADAKRQLLAEMNVYPVEEKIAGIVKAKDLIAKKCSILRKWKSR